MTSGLLLPLLGGREVAEIFSDIGRLQAMLDVEAALARAEAAVGVIPAAAAEAIGAQCRVEALDLDGFGDAAAAAGNLLIPLVRRLTAAVAAHDADAARYVHWGATSQDIIDTAMVVQLRAALAPIGRDLAWLSEALATLAGTHRKTPQIGRTWLQHALPVTFGLKAAGWLDAVERHRTRVVELEPRLLVLQFGGAAGTLASLGTRGLDVAAALARELDLALPALPWHGARDRLVELGAIFGLIIGTMGKIARDWSLLMQTEVGEVFEPAGAGRGGSSTMPHKRNPVAAASVLAAATRAPGLVATLMAAMVQEHERGLGNWPAEWVVLPELAVLTAGALATTADTIAGLEVDAARMRANIDMTDGLVLAEAVMMALAATLGRLEAHHLVEAARKRAVAERRHLRAVLADEPEVMAVLDAAALDRLFDPMNYLGVADALIARALAARRP
ncbi:MAG: 3-carboxy-cis,cis-muconate cycloisomerase [Alphaproteobacteria bacterium]|nr:3-carboxy-cis,cis-muconate cycloisomerase [Alphaproteobacteria bacterium]